MQGNKNEIWKDVVGYEGRYIVSNSGKIISTIRKKHIMLKPKTTKFGYYTVSLTGNKKIHISVHRVVAIAFIDNPKNHPTVNHINGDKKDNRAENLEWMSYFDNNMHAKYTGLNGEGKLTPALAIEIFEKAKTIPTNILANQYGVSVQTIRSIKSKRSWKPVTEEQAQSAATKIREILLGV